MDFDDLDDIIDISPEDITDIGGSGDDDNNDDSPIMDMLGQVAATVIGLQIFDSLKKKFWKPSTKDIIEADRKYFEAKFKRAKLESDLFHTECEVHRQNLQQNDIKLETIKYEIERIKDELETTKIEEEEAQQEFKEIRARGGDSYISTDDFRVEIDRQNQCWKEFFNKNKI